MSLIGNLLWIILGGGLIIFFEYLIGGLVLCLTIVGIPFGLQCFKLARLGLFPFGVEIYEKSRPTGCLSTLMNLIWLLFGGLWVALTHVVFGVLCAVTVIGLPFAKQHMKLAQLALTPFGKTAR